jgi:hypothetical protein
MKQAQIIVDRVLTGTERGKLRLFIVSGDRRTEGRLSREAALDLIEALSRQLRAADEDRRDEERRAAMYRKAAETVMGELNHPAVKAGLDEIMSDGFGE